MGRQLRLLMQKAIALNGLDIEGNPITPVLFRFDGMASLGGLTRGEQAYGLMERLSLQL